MFVCYIQGCRGDRGGDVVRNQGKRLNRQGSFWVVVVLGFDFVFERKKFFLAIRFLQFLISLSLSLFLKSFSQLWRGGSRGFYSRVFSISLFLSPQVARKIENTSAPEKKGKMPR